MPFRIGVGGCYRGGFEAACIELGLPWGKVEDYDLIHPERLQRFQVICLSEPRCLRNFTAMFTALKQFAENGGTVIVENYTLDIPSVFAGARVFFPGSVRRLGQQYGGILATDDSDWFKGIPPGSRFPLARDVPFIRNRGTPDKDWHGFGSIICHGRAVGPALWVRRLGKGRVIFSRVPFSFQMMWRGPALLRPLYSVLTALTAGKCRPTAPMPRPEPPSAPPDIFADDFMRAGPSLGPAWTVTGKAACTGPRGTAPHTEFAVRLDGVSLVTAAPRAGRGWAFSAAILPGKRGRGGLWTAVTGGDRLELALDGTGVIRLRRRRSDGNILPVANGPTPSGTGWHRISLVRTADGWSVFADGARITEVAVPAGEQPTGAFGLFSSKGAVWFDDVAARPASVLVPGTDRMRGEEGSCQAWGGLTHRGIEKHTVYSMSWLLRPDPAVTNGLRLMLPTFTAGVLFLDGRPCVRVQPDPDGAAAAIIPAPERSRRSVGFVAAGWRDYVFRGRVTDWYSTGADWEPLARWSCDPRWFWMGAETQKETALWYRHPLSSPYAISAVLAVGARRYFREEYRRGRDLNLCLGGDGRVPRSGLTVRVMNGWDRGIEVWRNGKRLAVARGVGLPSGHSLHHNWFTVTASVTDKRVRVGFDGTRILEVPLATPLPPGYVAVWTQKNSIRVARITLSLSQECP